jgi:hypothetical protein
MCSDLHVCLAEGEGLEPPSPFGQRFSSPLTAASRNVANVLWNPVLPGHKAVVDLHGLPASADCFRASDGLETACSTISPRR